MYLTTRRAQDVVMLTEDALLQMARDRRTSYERQAETFRLVRHIRRDRSAAVVALAGQRSRRRRASARHAQPAICPA
jgi:hypothetical protein